MSKLAKSTKSRVELLDDEDRISDLPDGIRCHILSFLDTKDAVATTILSTKWMNLWTTAPINIDFDDDETYGIEFAQIVDKVFRSHNLPIIKRFSLYCLPDPVYDVHSWVKMAILKKVQDLTLEIQNAYCAPFKLPTSFFTCETLEVLKLQGLIIVRMVGLCSLPRLKNLALEDIQYENDESAHMLISSCPSLEKLQITRYVKDGTKNFIIRSSATLKHLTIWHGVCETSDYSYVINSPGLQQLELNHVPIHGFVIENLSSLVTTDISFSNVSYIGLHDDNIHSLLQGFSNSKNLILDIVQSQIPAHLLPKFDRLSTLEVYMRCCKWHSLQEYIKNSDRLKVLTFMKHSCQNKKHLVCWRWNPKTVPICLLSSLKTMTFFGFDGLKDELRMVEYMLKNSKVLQKMDIRFEYSLQNTESASQLRQKLLKFSKGSEECQVVFS